MIGTGGIRVIAGFRNVLVAEAVAEEQNNECCTATFQLQPITFNKIVTTPIEADDSTPARVIHGA